MHLRVRQSPWLLLLLPSRFYPYGQFLESPVVFSFCHFSILCTPPSLPYTVAIVLTTCMNSSIMYSADWLYMQHYLCWTTHYNLHTYSLTANISLCCQCDFRTIINVRFTSVTDMLCCKDQPLSAFVSHLHTILLHKCSMQILSGRYRCREIL